MVYVVLRIFECCPMNLPTPENVRDYIANGLVCQHLDVTGDGQHFYATIVSSAFEGKRLIGRHQLVYAALGERMKAEVHALSMKTHTPAEYALLGSK
jgi:acid stress-induced BolA-like protein IbaG/YrbA